MADMRTPLGRVLGRGSAKSGTEHFWVQRLTAIATIPLAVFLIALVVALTGADYEAARACLANPLVSILLLLLILSGVTHMRVGMQDIIEDYVHAEGLKMLALIGNTFFSIAVGLACAYAALRLGFGS